MCPAANTSMPGIVDHQCSHTNTVVDCVFTSGYRVPPGTEICDTHQDKFCQCCKQDGAALISDAMISALLMCIIILVIGNKVTLRQLPNDEAKYKL
jgi:hypothetical protein